MTLQHSVQQPCPSSVIPLKASAEAEVKNASGVCPAGILCPVAALHFHLCLAPVPVQPGHVLWHLHEVGWSLCLLRGGVKGMKSHVGQTLRLPGSSCALGSKNCKKPVQTQVFVFDWSMVECEKMGVGDHHPDLFAFSFREH